METLVYRSKIGIELIALLAAGMIPGFVTTLAGNEDDKEIIYIVPVLFVLVLLLMVSTRYKIYGTTLRAYVLFFPYKPVDIHTITEIKDTNNPLSAPAASIDRLEVTHSKGYLLVSPKDKEGFIAALQQINPNIIYRK